MDEEIYRQRAAQMCDDALRHMIFEEHNQYLPEAMNAAQEELFGRNSDLLGLGEGDTVTLKEIVDRIDCDECLAVLKRLDDMADEDFYIGLLSLLQAAAPAGDGGILLHFTKLNAAGETRVTGTDRDQIEVYQIEYFSREEWLAAHIKKQYILENGRELAMVPCLLMMTEVQEEMEDDGTCP